MVNTCMAHVVNPHFFYDVLMLSQTLSLVTQLSPFMGWMSLGIGQVAGDLLRTPRDLRLGGNPHHGARSHIWT